MAELAAAHGVHRSWLYKLIARYRKGDYEALAPRSRRPRTCPHKTSEEIEQAIVALRLELATEGHDSGPQTITRHLERRFDQAPSVATIWRALRRAGLIEDQPQKRPRSSLIRFCAELPTEGEAQDETFNYSQVEDGRAPAVALERRLRWSRRVRRRSHY